MTTNQFAGNFNSLSPYLRGFAMKLTRDKTVAEDLYQETALNAFRHKDKFMENTNMKAWLGTIMRNSFINQFRKKRKRSEVQDFTDKSYFLNSFSGVVSNEGEMNLTITEITEKIDSLDEAYRIPFLMSYQGYKYNEIQEALGDLPMGTIKSRIFHARRMLKEQIQGIYDN